MTDNNTIFEQIKNSINFNASAEQQTEEIRNDESLMPQEEDIIEKKTMRVNLVNYAKKQAMAHGGYAVALKNLLNEIRCGHLIDENSDLATQEKHMNELEILINNNAKLMLDFEGSQAKIKDINIPELKKSIANLEAEIHQIELKKLEKKQMDMQDKFMLWKYGFLMLAGLVYVFVFYVSSVYMGMVRDIISEVTKANNAGDGASSALGAIFSTKAFSTFGFHYISPILIIMFAVVVDILWSKTIGKKRVIVVSLSILLTLILDGFIAYKIEKSNFDIKVLMGMAEPNSHVFWTSPDFYIVILMGFVGTIMWGIILVAFKTEINKADHQKIFRLEKDFKSKLIDDIKIQITMLENELIDLATKWKQTKAEIERLSKLCKEVKMSTPELERYITKVYDGWLQIVQVLPDKYDIRKECELVLNDFKATYLPQDKESSELT